MENSLSVAMLKEIPEYLQKTIRIEKKKEHFQGVPENAENPGDSPGSLFPAASVGQEP